MLLPINNFNDAKNDEVWIIELIAQSHSITSYHCFFFYMKMFDSYQYIALNFTLW